tara:strand:+ start:2422 stop:4533 length:2112 start_codon:yes stop_codon:yes gene_type:complete
MMGLFLLMLPLASLPVLFHYFMRTQAEKHVVTTFMFFNALDPRMKSRKKLKERLLLAMRVLFMLLVILALARIPFGQIPLLSGTQTTVIILDNSASMAMDGVGGESRLDDARQRIGKLLAAMDDNAKVAILLTCQDPAFHQLASLTSDHRKLKEHLSSIVGTHAPSGVEKAIARAERLLAEAGSGGSIHIFSDLQESDWGNPALGSDKDKLHVVVHRLPAADNPAGNVSIGAIKTPAGKILRGHRYPLQLQLHNHDDREAEVRLTFAHDDGSADEQKVRIPPHRPVTVSSEIQPQSAGNHWLQVRLSGDGFSGDNQAGVAYNCVANATVLLQGTPADYGVFTFAISPMGDGRLSSLTPRFVPLEEMEQHSMERPVLVVILADRLATTDADFSWLDRYVAAGGHALILPSLDDEKAPSGTTPPFVNVRYEGLANEERQERILDRQHLLWDKLKADSGQIELEDVHSRKHLATHFPDEYTALFGENRDQISLAAKEHGKGRIFVSSVAFDPDWGSLPLWRGFLPMIQVLAMESPLLERSETFSLQAGERFTLPALAGESVVLSTLQGDQPLSYRGKLSGMPPISYAGIYQLATRDRTRVIAVTPAVSETQNSFVSKDQIPALANVPHRILELKDSEALRGELKSSQSDQDLYLVFLMLAVLAFLIEGWLAFPQKARFRDPGGKHVSRQKNGSLPRTSPRKAEKVA